MKNNLSLEEYSLKNLIQYCEKESFKGWDPYDGLNSPIIQKTILGKSRFFRLAWIQLFKRNPINLRRVFRVKKDYNPKGLGLFLIGYCNLYKLNPSQNNLKQINNLANNLIELKVEGYSGACWGYNFDWQARAFYQPKCTPTVVATSFITEALFDAYEITNNNNYLDVAKSAKEFVLKDLKRTYDSEGNFTFSYSPLDKTQVFNAGLLGAKLLMKIYKHTREEILVEIAKSVVSYVCKKQNDDGSWAYGTLAHHQWIDNFHTGYNLECINLYQHISGDKNFKLHLNKGFDYYLKTFFTERGESKYYNNQKFPIDIHAPAQLIITLVKTGRLNENMELANRVLRWTIINMQTKQGYFIYQKRAWFSSKVPYMRWAQAWMFYALTYYKLSTNE